MAGADVQKGSIGMLGRGLKARPSRGKRGSDSTQTPWLLTVFTSGIPRGGSNQ